MKKLLVMLTLLLALMGLLVFELVRSDPTVTADTDSVELAERPQRARPASELRHRPPANMTELQRVIRQGSEP